jgi:hypothetical protein
MIAGTAVAMVCVLSGFGGGHTERVQRNQTDVSESGQGPESLRTVLSLSGLGSFKGICPPGPRSWTLRFVADPDADDALSYRVGRGPRRTIKVDPSDAVSIHLIPDATKTHEQADRFVPLGQARGVTHAVSVPTTAPLRAAIYQATESQTLLAYVRLALSTIGGESGQCVLVGSAVRAYTYPSSS